MKISEKGFSVSEALIVVIIIGILAVVGIPIFNSSLNASKLKAGSAILSSALSYAKMGATKNNCYYFVIFAKTGDKYNKIVIYRDTNSNFRQDPDDKTVYNSQSETYVESDPVERVLTLPEGLEFVLHGSHCYLRPYSFLPSNIKAIIFKPDGTLLPADPARQSTVGIKISDTTTISNDTLARYLITNIGVAEYHPF